MSKATHTYYPIGIAVNAEVEAHLERSWWARFCLRRIQLWGDRLLDNIHDNCEPVGITRDTKMPVSQ